MDNSLLDKNKEVVRRFNEEVIQNGNVEVFNDLMDDDFVNNSAPEGGDKTKNGMIHTFNNILRPAMPDMKVTVYQQIAEDDWVTTRKNIKGTHSGIFLGIAATGREISIDVVDMVRLKNGKYIEHWGLNTLSAVLAELRSGQ
ncbi:putative ester cyclase [Chryseobacterium ginsenosidimutans]|jgi:predicted ester cyclase|uniref:ester cyclase n=1 Tax=Chryseobacterium ginsenosidimutans TaxID=687846 RepID=UPI002169F71B|nr:ester cyclase [Chryseobacterium ginsenosidimutans]MCS3868295.1 putative ester cyclase [Chryseobacterium ginsenosidimutans]